MTFTSGHTGTEPILHYAEGGAGPTLLLLHGVTRCWGDWEAVLPALEAMWPVVALDQRGHGQSARSSSYLVRDYVSDAVRMVREQIAAPVVIFGHSLGAMVAAGVAAASPELVRGIVLEDPPFHTMGNRIAGSVWEAQFIGMREVARHRGDVEEMMDALAEIRLPIGDGIKRLGELRDRASLTWSAECLRLLDPEVLTPVIEGRWLDGYDVPTVLAGVRCPALLLQADPTVGGALTDPDAEAAMAALPRGTRVRFPGAGHQLHRERTEAVLAAVRDWDQCGE